MFFMRKLRKCGLDSTNLHIFRIMSLFSPVDCKIFRILRDFDVISVKRVIFIMLNYYSDAFFVVQGFFTLLKDNGVKVVSCR